MKQTEINIRLAEARDCDDVLKLMKELARFEGYLSQFCVTTAVLLEQGINQQRFQILVAEESNEIKGFLVYYFLPFTYDLKPWMLLKELFVEHEARNKGIGELLFTAAAKKLQECGGSRIKWEVLKDNLPAQRFYQRMNGRQDAKWLNYVVDREGIENLLAQ